MSGQHTPGPWHVEPVCGEDEQQFWSDDWNGKVWCVCHPRTECDASTVVPWINEGDARLIAAAPELLEACSDWIEWLKPDAPWREDAADYEAQMLDAMRAAIARATGAA
jgi:hypothetical protein